jgi:hypothetical protein
MKNKPLTLQALCSLGLLDRMFSQMRGVVGGPVKEAPPVVVGGPVKELPPVVVGGPVKEGI